MIMCVRSYEFMASLVFLKGFFFQKCFVCVYAHPAVKRHEYKKLASVGYMHANQMPTALDWNRQFLSKLTFKSLSSRPVLPLEINWITKNIFKRKLTHTVMFIIFFFLFCFFWAHKWMPFVKILLDKRLHELKSLLCFVTALHTAKRISSNLHFHFCAPSKSYNLWVFYFFFFFSFLALKVHKL